MHAARDGSRTTYTVWFSIAATKQCRLIASFRAPRDEKGLRGFYSFNENFHGANGDLPRDREFSNAWVRTRAGEWVALREAAFTHDDHGERERLDRWALERQGRFVLCNGGFLPEPEGAIATARERLTASGALGPHPIDAELPATPPTNATGR